MYDWFFHDYVIMVFLQSTQRSSYVVRGPSPEARDDDDPSVNREADKGRPEARNGEDDSTPVNDRGKRQRSSSPPRHRKSRRTPEPPGRDSSMAERPHSSAEFRRPNRHGSSEDVTWLPQD